MPQTPEPSGLPPPPPPPHPHGELPPGHMQQPSPPPPPPDLTHFVAQRAAAVHPQFAFHAPDLGLAFIASPLLTHQIASVTGGLFDWLTSSSSLVTEAGRNLAAGYGTTPAMTPQQLTAGVGTVPVTPQEQDRINSLPQNLQDVGRILAFQSRMGGGVPTAMVPKVRNASLQELDPQNLLDLFLHVGNGEVILRDSVRDMLAVGTGTVAKPAGGGIAPAAGPRLGQPVSQAIPAVPGIPANPNDPNYLRAVAALQLAHQLFPGWRVGFQSGGLLGQAFAGINQAENTILYPADVLARNATAGISRVPGFNHPLQVPIPPDAPAELRTQLEQVNSTLSDQFTRGKQFASPQQVWQDVQSTPGLAFGEQLAHGLNIMPTDPGYGAVVGFSNFVSDWYANPLIIAGKVGAGLKLAEAAPFSEAQANLLKGITEQVYRANARSVPELVFGTTAGNNLGRQGMDLLNKIRVAHPGAEAEWLAANMKIDMTQATALKEAHSPGEFLQLLADGFSPTSDRLAIQARVSELETELGKLPRLVNPAGGEFALSSSLDRAAQINAELAFNRGRLLTLADDFKPFTQLPKMSRSSRLFRFISDHTSGDLKSAMLDYSLSPAEAVRIPGTRVNLDRWFQEVTNRTLQDWHSPGQTTTMSDGLKTLDSFMKDYNVGVSDRLAVLEKFRSSANSTEWYTALRRDLAQAVEGGARGAGKENVIKWFRSAHVDNMFGVVPREVPSSIYSTPKTFAEPTWTHQLADGTEIAVPSKLTETVRKVVLPGHEQALDATGTWRRMLASMPLGTSVKEFATGAKVAEPRALAWWHAVQRLEDRVTALWRDGILLSRAPAVLTRTSLEHHFRIMMGTDHAAAMNQPLKWLHYVTNGDAHWTGAYLGDNPAEAFGSIADRYLTERPSADPRVTVKLGGVDHQAALQAHQAALMRHFGEPGMRELASGRTPEELVTWMREHPSGQNYFNEAKGLIDQPGLDLPIEQKMLLWARRNKQEQDALIGGKNDVRLALRTGELRRSDLAGLWAGHKSALDEAAALRQQAEALPFGLERDAMMRDARDMELEATADLTKYGAISKRRAAKAIASGSSKDPLVQRAMDTFTRKNVTVPLESDEALKVLDTWYKDGSWHPYGEVSGYLHGPSMGPLKARGARSWMYRNFLSKPDIKITRGPLFRQFADFEKARLLELGYPESQAELHAFQYASTQTRDLLYDLATRSSAQRFFRHAAPFLPAFESVIRSWMFKIPNRMFPIVGHAYLAERLHQVTAALSEVGIDPSKATVVPGLGAFLSLLFGGPGVVPTFKAKDLNLVTGSPSLLPGLGPIPSAFIDLAAQHSTVMRAIGDHLLPFGTDVSIGPTTIDRGWYAATGHPPPWEFLSPQAQDTYYGFAMDDGIRHAYAALGQEGIHPPDLNAKKYQGPAGETRYRKDAAAFQHQLLSDAQTYTRWWFAARAILAVVQPAPITMNDKYTNDLTLFYDRLNGLTKGSPEASQAYHQWLAAHPWGDLYLQPKTEWTGVAPAPKSPADATLAIRQFENEIKNGSRTVLSPAQFTAVGLGYASYGLYRHTLQANLDKISPTAPGLLRNWSERGTVMRDASNEWQRYLALNPTFQTWWNQSIQNRPDYSTQVEALSKAYTDLNDLQKAFTVDGIPNSQFLATKAKIGQLLSQAANIKAGAYVQADGINWWFQNVFTPQSNQVQKLYALAHQYKATSDPRYGDVFTRIAAIQNAEKPQTYKGQTYPTIEQWSWGAKDPQQQDAEIAKWGMLKPEWLTNFQLQQVGYKVGSAGQQFAAFVTTYDKTYQAQRDAISGTGSTAKQAALDAARQQAFQREATTLGSGATKLLDLMNATPGDRLARIGFFDTGPGTPYTKLDGYAKSIIAQLKAKQLSPAGTSALADTLKRPFFASVDNAYHTDASFRADINAITGEGTVDPKDVTPRYVVYAELFFGQFPFTLPVLGSGGGTTGAKQPTPPGGGGGGGNFQPPPPPPFGGAPGAPPGQYRAGGAPASGAPASGSPNGGIPAGNALATFNPPPPPSGPSGLSQNQLTQAAQQAGVPTWWVNSPELANIIAAESGGNPNAQNPSSTAFGIFQFLDSTWASTGVAKTGDPYLQWVAGLKYIKRAYGDPANAWAFHLAHGYY